MTEFQLKKQDVFCPEERQASVCTCTSTWDAYQNPRGKKNFQLDFWPSNTSNTCLLTKYNKIRKKQKTASKWQSVSSTPLRNVSISLWLWLFFLWIAKWKHFQCYTCMGIWLRWQSSWLVLLAGIQGNVYVAKWSKWGPIPLGRVRRLLLSIQLDTCLNLNSSP